MVLDGYNLQLFQYSFKEEKDIQTEYMKVIYENNPLPNASWGTKTRYIRSSDFIGPSSISLEVSNIIPIDGD